MITTAWHCLFRRSPSDAGGGLGIRVRSKDAPAFPLFRAAGGLTAVLVVLFAAAFGEPALAQTGDRPGKPIILTATAVVDNASRLQVTWAPPPASDRPIDYYVFRYWPMGEMFCGTECEQNSGTAIFSWTLVGLYAGTTYNVQILAKNAVGIGPASETATATTGLPAVSIGWSKDPKFPAGPTIPEGEGGRFQIGVDYLVSAPLTVNLDISTTLVSGVESGSKTVTIPAKGRLVDYPIQTMNDQRREGDGTVTAKVVAGTGYRIGFRPSATVTVIDYDQERSVPENSPPGTPVGAPFNVRDDDRSTYSVVLGGPDQDSFDVSWPSNRPSVIPIQILTRDGVVYDYEAKNLYVVTITVTNPSGSGQARVLIRLIDVPDGVPEISIEPVQASIWAGQDAQFRLIGNPADFQNVRVKLQVHKTRGSLPNLGRSTVTIPDGRSGAVYTVSTTDEDAGSITARVVSGDGYTIAAAPGNEAVVEVVEVGEGSGSTVRIRAAGADPNDRAADVTTHITEGEDAVFTLTADPAPLSDLHVRMIIDTIGDYGVQARRYPFTIPAGQSTVTHRVGTVDDDVDEPNGQVLASILCMTNTGGADCEIDFATDLARIEIKDNDGSGPVLRVNVEGASFDSLHRITEGETARFVITTDPPGAWVTRGDSGGVNWRITLGGGDFGARHQLITGRDVSLPHDYINEEISHGNRILEIHTTDDNLVRPDGRVTLRMLPHTGSCINFNPNNPPCTTLGYELPSDPHQVQAILLITDNDGPPNPTTRPVYHEVEGESRLRVQWDEVPEATGYDVRWGAAAESSRQTARVTAPEFTTPELSPGVEHSFDVSACNAAGCSEPSPEVQGSVEQESPSGWASPNFRAVDGSPPLIQWDAYPEATGYTVEFTAPINWTGRKDNGHAEMFNAGPQYTMRAKAHGDGWESEWTDWFNTCRPPYVHQGGPNDPPDCVESTESTETPPTADAGSDRQAERSERVELSGTGASHADGSQELSYQWRIAEASHGELSGAAAHLEHAGRAQAALITSRSPGAMKASVSSMPS